MLRELKLTIGCVVDGRGTCKTFIYSLISHVFNPALCLATILIRKKIGDRTGLVTDNTTIQQVVVLHDTSKVTLHKRHICMLIHTHIDIHILIYFKLVTTHIASRHMVQLLIFRSLTWYDVIKLHLELTTCVCYSAPVIVA